MILSERYESHTIRSALYINNQKGDIVMLHIDDFNRITIIKATHTVLDLRFQYIALDVCKSLAQLPRTGWVMRNICNPKSVQDHTVALREIACLFTDLSDHDKRDLVDMLEVHDWPEHIHGDEVILTCDITEKRRLKSIKFENTKH